jgi:hypothetical protein
MLWLHSISASVEKEQDAASFLFLSVRRLFWYPSPVFFSVFFYGCYGLLLVNQAMCSLAAYLLIYSTSSDLIRSRKEIYFKYNLHGRNFTTCVHKIYSPSVVSFLFHHIMSNIYIYIYIYIYICVCVCV